MAVYNGEQFLKEQIESILSQLSAKDELIIVDDCSSDNSTGEIESFNDNRIKLLRNKNNLGHVKTFERAVLESKNLNILFADQDDIWADGHVDLLLKMLNNEKRPVLVYGNFDEFGLDFFVKTKGHVSRFPKLKNSNLQFGIHLLLGSTRMFGCCLGVNRNLIDLAMPFPEKASSHDLWLGYVAFRYGKIFNHDKIITHRRLHSNNVSQPRRNIFKIIADRAYYIRKLYSL